MAVRIGLAFLLAKREAAFGRRRGGTSEETTGCRRARSVTEGEATGALDRIMEKRLTRTCYDFVC